MSAGAVTTYDEIPYSATPFYHTHPDCLGTLATLFGLAPARADRCRVLELGCGRGGNLIPMAQGLPDSLFVGIDLSRRQIAGGREIVRELGLTNIDLRALSILEVGPELGRFDYIICHGVYSWVPDEVQDKILAVCKDNLAPQGVAYVSYNTYPGWHLRGVLRDMLGFHLRRVTDPHARLEGARAFLDFLAEASEGAGSGYGRVIEEHTAHLRPQADSYLFHEFLEEVNRPLYFHEFAARAGARGLQYLTEAQSSPLPSRLEGRVRGRLDLFGTDLIDREQYADFLRGRQFRRTLLCHDGVALRRPPDPETVTGLYVATRLRPRRPAAPAPAPGAEEFVTAKGVSMTTDNPFVRAALHFLVEAWPRSVPFKDVWEAARARVAESAAAPAGLDERGPRLLAEPLLQCFLADLVELQVHPPRFAPAAGDRPRASPLARLQAAAGEPITNLRHYTAELEDLDRLLLPHLDGSRDRPALGAVVADLVGRGVLAVGGDGTPGPGGPLSRDDLEQAVENSLRRVAAAALLLE
jgi:SAM-dependent methyltransferase